MRQGEVLRQGRGWQLPHPQTAALPPIFQHIDAKRSVRWPSKYAKMRFRPDSPGGSSRRSPRPHSWVRAPRPTPNPTGRLRRLDYSVFGARHCVSSAPRFKGVNAPCVCGKSWLFDFSVKTRSKSGALYNYTKFRINFIRIRDVNRVRLIPGRFRRNRDGWQPKICWSSQNRTFWNCEASFYRPDAFAVA